MDWAFESEWLEFGWGSLMEDQEGNGNITLECIIGKYVMRMRDRWD